MQRWALQESADFSNTIIVLQLCHFAIETFLQIHQSQQSPNRGLLDAWMLSAIKKVELEVFLSSQDFWPCFSQFLVGKYSKEQMILK